MYSLIRLTAYEPDPAAGDWVEDYHVIRFSEERRDELMNLYALHWKGREGQVGLPTGRLNELLPAGAPGVVAIGRRAGADADVPWIYGREQVPTEVLRLLINSWVLSFCRGEDKSCREPEHRETLFRVLDSPHSTVPEWTVEQVRLTATSRSSGGTAEPEQSLYALLPEIIAARLAARPFHSAGLTQPIRFRILDREQGAELVSWPPFEFVHGRRSWFYSAIVRIAVHTVPFADAFRVHASTGIRRWATGARLRLPPGRGAGVLLDVGLPWTGGPSARARLASNGVKYSPTAGRVDWSKRSPAGILAELDIMRQYPSPVDLLADPERWIRGQDGVAAGIVYSTALAKQDKHEVGDGLGPAERARLDEWVEEGLRPWFRRVPDLARVKLHTRPALRPKASSSDPFSAAVAERETAGWRRATLRAALAKDPVEIEIAWQYPETRDELLRELCELLGVPTSVVNDHPDQRWEDRDLRVHVRTWELGRLGAPLEVNRGSKQSRAGALGEAIQARRAAVADYLHRPAGPGCLTIVELGGEDVFAAQQDSDPKFALRLGFADTGRLTQFITIPGGDSDPDVATKAKWTWLDGFRQMGAVALPEPRIGVDLPDNLQYAALWLVRRRANSPTRRAGHQLIALRIRPEDTEYPVRGWDDAEKEWVPYPRLLLNLAGDVTLRSTADEGAPRWPTLTELRADTERRVRSLLYQLSDRPTVLFASPPNLRYWWPGLGNGSLVKDAIGFAEGTQRLGVYGSDLRIVLVRGRNNRDEVPEFYAPNGPDGVPGHAEGLWAPPEAGEDHRVFLSTAGKPHSARHMVKGMLKLGPHPDWAWAPAKKAWNPRCLELTVLGCLSPQALAAAGRADATPDRPATWAALAHQLRLHEDYVPLARPLPLHLAKLAAEYVLPVDPDKA